MLSSLEGTTAEDHLMSFGRLIATRAAGSQRAAVRAVHVEARLAAAGIVLPPPGGPKVGVGRIPEQPYDLNSPVSHHPLGQLQHALLERGHPLSLGAPPDNPRWRYLHGEARLWWSHRRGGIRCGPVVRPQFASHHQGCQRPWGVVQLASPFL